MNKMRMKILSKRFQQAMNDRSSTTNLDLISSDEDENGFLKPSRRPINEHTRLTTDFNGNPMRYEKPTLPKIKLHEPKIRVSEAKKTDEKMTHLDSMSQLNAIA
jgi:hypothetical protein